jgi:DNA-binding CsgD family transcriptional regulator
MTRRAMTTPLPLSARQTQVLRLYAHGYRGPEIAAALGISPETVHHHTMGILRRLEAHTQAHAVFRYLVHYRNSTHVVPACTETHPPAFPPRYVRGMNPGVQELDRWVCFECEKISQERTPQRHDWPPRREGVSA